MRVAHLITRMIVGGAQENTLLCCRELAEAHGDEVLLITGPEAGPEGDLLQHGGTQPFSVHYASALRRAIHPLRDPQAYRQLRRQLHDFAPDVVHTHSAKAGVLGRAAAAALSLPAIVHTVHGAPFHPYQSGAVRQLYRQCERWAARRCHALISVADAMTTLLVEARVAPRNKFTTIYSGMDVTEFLHADRGRTAVRRRWGFTDEHVVVGKIARLSPLKGHADLISAAHRIVRRQPQVRFLLVGGGRLQSRFEREIKQKQLEPFFQFTGLVRPSEIGNLIGGMDLLVHTSLREGLARCLPQALIAGKPVVAYDVDGAREVVIPGETGSLVPPRDIAGLAEALERLVADPESRARLGNQGPRWAAQFDYHATTAQIRALYQRLLSDPPAP